MMIRLISTLAGTAALACLLAGSAGAQTRPDVPAGTYKLDPNHASVTWKVSHMGLSRYTARFTKVDAQIVFDPSDPTKSSLTASVDPTSVRTDYPNAAQKDFDKELRDDPRFFKVGQFPEVKFVSRRIEMTGDKTGRITGDLTFMGVTKPMALDVTLNGFFKEHPASKKPALGFSAVGTIKRSEFGMDALVPIVGDEVQVLIEAEFAQS